MERITFSYLVSLALKNIKVLIITALCFAIGTTAYCLVFEKPTYTATSQLMVATSGVALDKYTDGGGIQNSDISASLNLAVTTKELLQSDELLSSLAKKMNNIYSCEDLKSRQSITRYSEAALLLRISFTASSKAEAIAIANEYIKLAPAFVREFIPSAYLVPIEASSVTKTAGFSVRDIFYMTAFGIILAYLVLLVKEAKSPVIRDEYKLLNNFEVDIIGSVPQFSLGCKPDNDKEGEE